MAAHPGGGPLPCLDFRALPPGDGVATLLKDVGSIFSRAMSGERRCSYGDGPFAVGPARSEPSVGDVLSLFQQGARLQRTDPAATGSHAIKKGTAAGPKGGRPQPQGSNNSATAASPNATRASESPPASSNFTVEIHRPGADAGGRAGEEAAAEGGAVSGAAQAEAEEGDGGEAQATKFQRAKAASANSSSPCRDGWMVANAEGTDAAASVPAEVLDSGAKCRRLCRPLMASCPANLQPLREVGEDFSGACISTRCVSAPGALRLLAQGAYLPWRHARHPKTGLYARALSMHNADGADWEKGDTGMTGLGMAFECVAHAMKFTSLAHAQDHVLLTLRSLMNKTRKMKVGRQIKGCFSGTINTKNGKVPGGEDCDTGKTGLLVTGALLASTYFRKVAPISAVTTEISDRATQLFDSVKWEKLALCEPATNSSTTGTLAEAKSTEPNRTAPALKVPTTISRSGACRVVDDSLDTKVNAQTLFLQLAHRACGAIPANAHCILVKRHWNQWKDATLTVGQDFWYSYLIHEMTDGPNLEKLTHNAKKRLQRLAENRLTRARAARAVHFLPAAGDDALPFVLSALAEAQTRTHAGAEPGVALLRSSAANETQHPKRGTAAAEDESDLSAALFGLTSSALGVEWWHTYTKDLA